MAAKGVESLSVLAFALALLTLAAAPAATAGDVVPAPSQAADDWPVYGGSAAHGFSNAAVLPPRLGLVWTFAGNATLGSAVEADGFVYVADVDTTTAPSGPHLVVHKLEEATGAHAWYRRVNVTGGAAVGAPRTLAVDAARVYVLYTVTYNATSESQEILAAIDAATGQVGWTFNGTARWTSPSPNATRSAPVLAGGLAVFGSQDGSTYAVNAATGALAWSFPTGAAVETVPAVHESIVYVTANATLYYLDLAGRGNGDNGTLETGGWSGDELLRVGAGAPIRASPVVASPYVYLDVDGDVRAFDRVFGGAPGWSYETAQESEGTPALAGTYVLARRSDGRVHAIDGTTGEVRWVRGDLRAPARGEDMAAADGRVFLSARNGTSTDLVALDASDGSVLDRNATDRPALGAPIAAGGKVLVAEGARLLAFRGQPDLAVFPEDVTMPPAVVRGGVARSNLTVSVRNVGDEPAADVRVRVYDGAVAPENLVADFTLGATKPIKAGARAAGYTQDWGWTVGRHEITVLVERALTETNTENNEASVFAFVPEGPSPPPTVVGAGPYVVALLGGFAVGGVVLYVPLKRLRRLRKRGGETKP